MASIRTLLKNLINVNNCVINSFDLTTNSSDQICLDIHLRPHKNCSCRCPICGRKGKVYDSRKKERCWRALDCGGIIVNLHCAVKRIDCPVHDVITEAVPWAFRDSRFTKDFDLMATYLAMNTSRSAAAELLRCDWHTIMRCISRAKDYLEPDIKKRYDNLVNIGIDETSYKKGHRYLTVVVNQDINTVVWCAEGHSAEVLAGFFKELTQEQRDAIKTVSGDGARWIDSCIQEYIPNAARCIDPFHVVCWANESLDELRKELWREAFKAEKELKNENKRGRGRPKKNDGESQKINKSVQTSKEIKISKLALGKAPEHLTERQRNNLELIAKTSPKLFRAYKLKEQLRLALKLSNEEDVRAELKRFHFQATHSRIPKFKELAYKIRRHLDHIVNTVICRQSSAKVEALNNKIKLIIRKAYGFRNIENLIDMVLLGCSQITIPLPNRGDEGLQAA